LKSIIIVFILFFQLSFSQHDDIADYEIYSLILTEQLKFGQSDKTDSIVLVEINSVKMKTIDWWQFERDSTLIARIAEEPELKITIESISQNIESQDQINTILFNFENIHFKIITDKEQSILIDEMNKKNKQSFIIRFSKVNYNGNFAAITYSYYCGGRCAGEDMIIYEKIDNKWVLLTQINLWIA